MRPGSTCAAVISAPATAGSTASRASRGRFAAPGRPDKANAGRDRLFCLGQPPHSDAFIQDRPPPVDPWDVRPGAGARLLFDLPTWATCVFEPHFGEALL
jgi:hypothetical protein